MAITNWMTTTGSNLFYHFDDLDMKIANILAELYLSKDDNMSQFFFYNHDFYKIPAGKVLRIRIDIVDQSKLLKRKKRS
jgi:hypothetical protein